MNYLKIAIYTVIFLIGPITLIGGLFPTYIETYLLPKRFVILNSNWIIKIGLVFVIIGLLLLTQELFLAQKNYKFYIEIFLILILLISVIFTVGWLYGQYEHTIVMSTENIENMKEQLTTMYNMDNIGNDNPFYSKKIIIRDDDVGNSSYIQSVRWLSSLCIEKNVKVTYAVIPAELISNPDTVAYLKTLDKMHFEFAAHGYKHETFEGLSYDEQHDLIKNATVIVEDKLNYRPFTFVPPQGTGDINTTKVCKFLGYHSITDVLRYPSYVIDFISNFEWEENYNPISHHKLKDFKSNFDKFYNASNEYYIVYLHDWTFLDEQYRLESEKTVPFEEAVDYMKRYNVQFFTIEEAYRWKIDEPNIRTFKIDKHNYAIDLSECQYNHTIKFNSPLNVSESIIMTDMSTNDKTIFDESCFEFDGLKGHWYTISISDN